MQFSKERQEIVKIAANIFDGFFSIEGAPEPGGYYIDLQTPIVEASSLRSIVESGLNILSIGVSRANTIAIKVQIIWE